MKTLAIALLLLTQSFDSPLLGLAQDREAGEVLKVPLLPPGAGNPRNSEGDFIALKEAGVIMFIYTHFTGGASDHSRAQLMARYSGDGGKTWTLRDQIVLPNEGTMNIMSVSLLRLKSGGIGLFYLRKNSQKDCRPYLRISTDEGKNWDDPILCVPDEGYFVLNNSRAVQLKSGRVALPVARHVFEGDKYTGRSASTCYYSDDEGKTWKKSATDLEAPPESKSGLQEPLVVELKDGRLMMLSRTDLGCQYRSYSRDNGETWSAAEASDIKSPLSPASVARIPSTGDLLLVWNDHSDVDEAHKGKRTPFRVAISRDEGKTWEKTKTLDDDPEGWYCYTAITFVGERVLLAHCAGDSKIGRLSRTRMTSFPLDWLYK